MRHHEMPQAAQTPTRAFGRALTGGSFLFASLLCACGSGGTSPSGGAAAAPVPAPAQSQSTKVLTLAHGLGFVCTVSQDGSKVYCWASEAQALLDGNAAAVGLTSTVPAVVATNSPGTICAVVPQDHAVYYRTCGNDLIFVVGTAGSTANSYVEDVTCTVLSADEFQCPEAVSDLTFASLRRFDLRWDPRTLHYPHSATWFAVRRAA